MSSFEAKIRLNLTDIAVGVPSEEAIAQGVDAKLEVQMGVALAFDAFRNQTTGEPLMIPLGEISVSLDKDQAAAYVEAIAEGAERLPEPKKSDVLVASNLGEVEKAMASMNKLTGK